MTLRLRISSPSLRTRIYQGLKGDAGATGATGATGADGPSVTDGDKGDITVSVSGSVWTIDSNVVTYAKLQTVSAARLVGNPNTATLNASEISLGTTLAFSGTLIHTTAGLGDVTWPANSFSATITAGAVTNAKFRQSSGLSVVGRSANSAGDVADITGTDGQLLRISGTVLGFGQLNLAASTTGTLVVGSGGTGATTLTNHGIVLGQGTSATVATAAMSDGQLLVGQTSADPLPKIVSGDVTLAASGAVTIGNNAVTYAKLQDISTTQRVIARNTAGSGDAEEVSLSTILDWIAPTRGALVTRGASGWQALNPGPAGQVVTSAGSGADLVYSAAAGTGTVTNVATDASMYGGAITTTGTLGVAVPCDPGGRVTLQTGVPVMTTTQSAKTTIYYAPYKHRFVPIYDGTRFVQTDTGGELSQATTDATKSPAAVVAEACYDLFVWNDSSTIRSTRGPAWSYAATVTMTIASPCVVTWTAHGLNEADPVVFTTTGALPTGITAGTVYYVGRSPAADTFNVSTTVANAGAGTFVNTSGSQSGVHTGTNRTRSRGTGAGTTELERILGVYVNKQAITNGPSADRGTYVGTVRSNGSSQIDWIYGVNGAPPTAAAHYVWNMYNRVIVSGLFGETTATWTYAVNTWREIRGDSTATVTYVDGMAEEAIEATYYGVYNAGSGTAVNGVGIGSTTASNGVTGSSSSATAGVSGNISAPAIYKGIPGLGCYFAAMLERSVSSVTITGIGNTVSIQSGLAYTFRM